MKLIYMDESGTGSIEQEPILFVTAVIVDADEEWREIDEDIKNLIHRYIPLEDRRGFAFHATNLFHGGKYFDKDLWSRELRWKILAELVRLIRIHQVPIAYGLVDRRLYEPIFAAMAPPIKPRHKMAILQATAFAYAAAASELWLQTFTADETGLMIAEDNPDVRAMVRHFHTELKNPEQAFFKSMPQMDLRPLSQVIDTVHFATKADTRILQLADVAAFVLRRAFARHHDVDRFVPPIAEAINWQYSVIIKQPVTAMAGVQQ